MLTAMAVIKVLLLCIGTYHPFYYMSVVDFALILRYHSSARGQDTFRTLCKKLQ